MVRSLALLFTLALVQASFGSPCISGNCGGNSCGGGWIGGGGGSGGGCYIGGGGYSGGSGYIGGGGYTGNGGYIGGGGTRFVESTCGGGVVEQEVVVNRAVDIPYTYTVPQQSQQCYQVVETERSVTPQTYVAGGGCQNQVTVTNTPVTDITLEETPLCQQSCTYNDYVIQIPIRETTCQNTPYCQQTTRAQNNVYKTVDTKQVCNQQVCSQNVITDTPIYDTVCQTYQTNVPVTGTQTVIQPEVITELVQLPSYPCVKPVNDDYYYYNGYGCGGGSGSGGYGCGGYGCGGSGSGGYGCGGSGCGGGCFIPSPAPVPLPTPCPGPVQIPCGPIVC